MFLDQRLSWWQRGRQIRQVVEVDVENLSELLDQLVRGRATPVVLSVVEILRRDGSAVLAFDTGGKLLLAQALLLAGVGDHPSKGRVSGDMMPPERKLEYANQAIS